MISAEESGRVYALTMSKPPVNAFDGELVDSIHRHLDAAEAAGASVLRIRSSAKVFSAGADLKMMRALFSDHAGCDRLIAHVKRMQDLFDRIEAANLVSIAEISGAALGGGFELALACDLRVAANEASIGLPEARMGLLPGAGGTQRLSRLCSEMIAKRIILGCEILDGQTAAALGIVQWAVPRADLPAFCDSLAQRMGEVSGAALAASKRCMQTTHTSIRAGLDAELAETRKLLDTADTQSRIRQFLDSRNAA